MRSATILGLSLVISVTLGALADDDSQHSKHPAVSSPALEQFKGLAGKWVGKMGTGSESHDAVVTYKVTSNGSAVVETIDPGGAHEMVTVIHSDGDELVLTHYCAIGNQPRMRASGKSAGKNVKFAFVDATNLRSPKDMHMHDVAFEFVDKDTLKTTWRNFLDGKPHETATFELKRAK
jgi:hypothetical protein